ncbi:helix-turn-helix domain-containing protein [Streptomyces sp. NPDC052727]|uniref:helix-turn-helix domain-containing protein n=1 Tax=Streptomyces sp. NPDC052727 TaxID=3154854 RepID=UPI003427D02C
MRFPQGGGLTPERQAFRERIRLEAADRFAAGASNVEVAKDLRVSVRSVQRADGHGGVIGPGEQRARLRGPSSAAHPPPSAKSVGRNCRSHGGGPADRRYR